MPTDSSKPFSRVKSFLSPLNLLSGLSLFLLLLSSSCDNDDYFLSASVSPERLSLEMDAGDSLVFRYDCSASNQQVSFIRITRVESNGLETVLIDSNINRPSLRYFLIQSHRGTTDTLNYTLRFECAGTEEGNTVDIRSVREFPVASDPLLPLNSFSLNTFTHPDPNAFSLGSAQVLTYPGSPDSTISFVDTSSVDTLSKVWNSPKGGLFVKFNTFNFNEATNTSIRTAFESGNPTNLATGLTEGDVLLYREPTNSGFSYAVVRISRISTVRPFSYSIEVKSASL